MINEAIILAGGLGTRLRSVVSDIPKCMAPVSGKPFLYYVTDYLHNEGIEHFIFSVGYKHDIIEEYLQKNCRHLNYTISLEKEALGTGGAVQLACEKTVAKNLFVCNGDTLYKIDLKAFGQFHESVKATCTLALKPMHYFDRYGVVELNKDGSVKTFKEKQYYTTGLINGGVYALEVAEFLNEQLPEKFSFEKDFLEKTINEKETKRIFGMIQDEYFIDIGIPEDYKKAAEELQH